MKNIKFAVILSTAVILLTAQVGGAFAAPSLQEPVTNTVTGLECGLNGISVLVTYDDGDPSTPEIMVEVSMETAVVLGFVPAGTETCYDATVFEGIGEPIDAAALVPVEGEEKTQHPVGAALSEYFSDLGVDYDTIMAAHEDGTGFGVLAQALWLAKKMDGNSETFMAIVQAKKDKDFSGFELADGSTPTNWGQFKKAALNGDKNGNLGVVMSGKGKDKDKSNNGKGSENSNKNKDK